jgi:ribonuclease HI
MAKFYAIKEGYDSSNKKKVENIVVNTWDECLKYVKGVKGAKYKSFKTLEEARNFFDNSFSGFKKSDKTYPKDCIHIYVDGSYSMETEEYSYGVVAVENEVVLYIESGKGKAKNIRQIAGELKGAIRGVEYAFKTNRKKVVIFHDYMGICYHATGFWSRNGESSKRYYEKMQEFIKKGMEIIFVKVDSHTGDLFNELVDEKCKEVLKIDSDKVVEKWLKNKEIKVISKEVKEQILSIAPKGEENIKIV